jgi:hypothetical protein
MQKQGWHVANWGFLGWLETGLKLIGLGSGFIAYFASNSNQHMRLLENLRLGALAVLALLTVFTLIALIFRVMQREVISLIFAVLNVLGHSAGLLTLVSSSDKYSWLIILGICFVLGELVKQRFLTTTGYTESGQTTSGMLRYSRVAMAIYLLFVVLLLV